MAAPDARMVAPLHSHLDHHGDSKELTARLIRAGSPRCRGGGLIDGRWPVSCLNSVQYPSKASPINRLEALPSFRFEA